MLPVVNRACYEWECPPPNYAGFDVEEGMTWRLMKTDHNQGSLFTLYTLDESE